LTAATTPATCHAHRPEKFLTRDAAHLLVIFIALVFTYINGFHDTANSIATVVSTKVLTPRQAVMLAAVTNLIGAFFGVAVARRFRPASWTRRWPRCP